MGDAAATGVRYAAGEAEQRPWGAWQVLAIGPGYVLKRVTVDPGRRLSLQYHHHRSEHWVIVEGAAVVELDGVVSAVPSGGHVHIPVLTHHRIANEGSVPLTFIEVQTGDLLDETDIVRLQDDFGR